MKHQQEIIEAIKSAINYLESSLKALMNKDENEVARSVWLAAAELEYANFFFSLMQDEPGSHSWKLKLRSKQVEMEPLLVSAQDLLKEAEGDLDAGGLHGAYKKTWMARGYLLKVQEVLEKGQKKGERPSSTG